MSFCLNHFVDASVDCSDDFNFTDVVVNYVNSFFTSNSFTQRKLDVLFNFGFCSKLYRKKLSSIEDKSETMNYEIESKIKDDFVSDLFS